MTLKSIIFGSGYHGRSALRALNKKKFMFRPLCFVDNDKAKHFKFCLKKKIFPVEKLDKIEFDKIILCGRNIENQINQLKKYRIPKEKYIFLGKSEIKPDKKSFLLRSKLLLRMLKYVIEAFNKEKIEYWIDYSGLLSLLRKDDFAKLSDVEISINKKNIKQLVKILSKKNNIFTIHFIFKKNKKFIRINKKKFNRIVIFSNTKSTKIEIPHIDFVIKELKQKTAENIYENGKDTLIKFWKKEKRILFKNLSIRVPDFTYDYIRLLYGKNWRRSVEFWGLKNKKYIEVKKSYYYNLLKY